MDPNFPLKLIVGYCAIGLLCFMIFLVATFAHCSTTTKQSNAFGAVVYAENPFTYLAGSVTEAFNIEEGKGLVVRVQPVGTYALFTSDVMLCNYPVDQLEGKKNPLVLVFETQAHRTIQGIGCHKLVAVREIKPLKEADGLN